MTVFQSKVEALSFFKETTFGTDYSASYASFYPVPFNEGTCEWLPQQPLESPMHAQQRIHGNSVKVKLPKLGSTLKFTCNLETFTTKAVSTVAATHSWLTRMLEIALGSVHQVTGTTAAAGWNTTTGDVAVGTTLRAGSAIAAVYSTTGQLEAREIESNDGSETIVLKLALSEAPSTSEVIYGSTTVYASSRDTGYAPSGQFLVQRWNTENRYLLKGCVLQSLTITCDPGTIPKLTFAWHVTDWDQADGSATAQDLTGSVLSAQTYVNANTLVAMDSELLVQTVATSTRPTPLDASSVTFEPNLAYVMQRSPGGVNTVAGWVHSHTAPVIKGSFTVPYEDAQMWFTARDDRTAKLISYQIGSSATVGACLISAPCVQITDVQTLDNGGIDAQVVSWEGRLDEDVTETSGYEGLGESAFRMHFF